MEGEGTSWTETGDSEAMPSGSQPVITHVSLMKEVLIPVLNSLYHAYAQGLKEMHDMSVAENSGNDQLDRVKEKQDLLLVELTVYKVEKKNH